MLRIHEPWLTEALQGRKTVDGRPGRKGEWLNHVGKITGIIHDDADGGITLIEVTAVRHYTTLRDYLIGEDWKKCAPHCSDLDDAVASYEAIENSIGEHQYAHDAIARRGGINAIVFELL